MSHSNCKHCRFFSLESSATIALVLATQEEGSSVVTLQTRVKKKERKGRRFQILSTNTPDHAKKQTKLTFCVLQVCAA